MRKRHYLWIAGAAVAAGAALVVGLGLPATRAPSEDQGTAISETPAALTVSVAPPETAQWPIEIEASGWLAPWQEAVISAEVGQQRVVSVNADVGDTVAKDDVLAELSGDTIRNDIAQLEASLDSAEASLELATADAERARRLTGGGSISEQQVSEYLSTERQAKANVASVEAQLASARLDLEKTQVLAVSGGVISERSASLGEVVAEGEELFRLIRDGRVEWQAEVPLIQLRSISVDTAVIIPSPFGDIHGTVRRISPSASESNGRVLVYVSIDDPPEGPDPKTGMMIGGRFVIGESEALSVPSSAIVMQDGFSYVFALDEAAPTTATRIRVETGRRRDDRVEILSDLSPEAQVVQSGGAFLSEGSTVRIGFADEAMTSAESERASE